MKFFAPHIRALAETDDLDTDLRQHARITLTGFMNPEILQMRRLVTAEAERYPEIGRAYFERSWGRTCALLARTLARLTERGLLQVADPERAAYTYTWLVVSIPANRVAFFGDAATYTTDELHTLADEAARIFLAAYRPSTIREN